MKFLNKDEAIIKACKQKSVLHLGCVGYADLTKEERLKLLPQTLHHRLYHSAERLFGLDYSREVIESIKGVKEFSDVFYGNVEKLEEVDIDEQFDVIVIGDLIEHLSNPGLMLEGIKKFCNDHTEIIITTPNAFGGASFLRFSINKFSEGNEHVMCFNKFNLENFLVRHGYKIRSIDSCYQKHATKTWQFWLFKNLIQLFPKFGGTLFFKISPR